jgi:D-arabinonate dehydratase/D-galactarolactone cycloisomerase
MTRIDEINRQGKVDQVRGMRIASVEPVLLSYTYPPEHVQTWSGGRLPGITAGLVRITTEDGQTGIGETYAGTYAPEVVRSIIEYFAPFLVGKDPSDISGLWNLCYSRTLYWGRFGISISVLSGIEGALWDLVGKAAGTPVHVLLGGPSHESLPRYASGGMDSTPDELYAEQSGYAQRGFLASKIRAGVGPREDADRTAIARGALGSGVALAVDAVQGSNPSPWSPDVALDMARRIAEYDILWLEEPCAATDVEGYATVRRSSPVPIAGGESCTTVIELSAYIKADALDLVQPDAAHIGGVLECRKAAALAEDAGLPIAVHAWSSGGCVMANYHAAFASPNTTWLEYPTQPNPLIEALMTEPLQIVDGRVLAPTTPGLGITLTPELEERYPYRPGHHYLFEERRSADQR